MNTAIDLLREMVREDLQLGWSYLEDDHDDHALRHFNSAIEKVNQIKNLRHPDALESGSSESPKTHSTDNHPNDTKGN